MSTFRSLIHKLSIFVSIFLAGIVSAYIGYALLKKYESVQDFKQLIEAIWNYKLYSSNTTILTAGKLIIATFLFIVSRFIANFLSEKIVSRILNRTKVNKGAAAAIQNLTYYILLIICFVVALNIAEIPLTIFTLFGGALAIGLGFGSQNMLSNFISGIILQIEQPVKVGDIVEIEGVQGTVEHIGGRSTKILGSNNTHSIIPNSYFLDKKFNNWTLVNNVIRTKIEIGLEYDSNIELVEKVIYETINSMPEIQKEPKPRLLLADFGSSSLVFHIYLWIALDTSSDRSTLESNFRKQILINFKKNKINIAYPQQIIQVRNGK